MQQICKTNKLFVQCHLKGTLTTQLRIQKMEVKFNRPNVIYCLKNSTLRLKINFYCVHKFFFYRKVGGQLRAEK